ncbi:MAG: YfcC family protein [Lachnospiraceae bacterium]|nr:YfcC family protein [Lachnospiraceae bacterium]
MENKNTKKSFWQNFKMPNSYVIIFFVMVVAAVLTWIVPAGQYDRAVDPKTGREVIVQGSYHEVDPNPVGPIGVFKAVADGFVNASDIVFFIIFAYGFVYMLIKNGTFDALMGTVMRVFRKADWVMFVAIMLLFGVLGATMGMAEETYGMFPIFIGLAVALGYDAIVGGAIVSIGATTGFSSAILNPFSLGVASGIAGVSITDGMWFRLVCWVVFEAIAIGYVLHYAFKIKKDPTKSILYGTKLELSLSGKTKEEMMELKMNWRHKACAAVFVLTICILVYGTLVYGWYIQELSTLFIIAMVIAGLIGGNGPSEIVENFVEAARIMINGAMIVGMARGILIVLQSGLIIDTIVYGMSSLLEGTSGIISGILMIFVQNVINFFVPSGSGQAAVSMPIMAPLADMLGLTRNTAILAYLFGSGYSDMFWPTSVCMICGLMGIPVNKWYKFVTPLFGLFMAAQVVLMTIAVVIHY